MKRSKVARRKANDTPTHVQAKQMQHKQASLHTHTHTHPPENKHTQSQTRQKRKNNVTTARQRKQHTHPPSYKTNVAQIGKHPHTQTALRLEQARPSRRRVNKRWWGMGTESWSWVRRDKKENEVVHKMTTWGFIMQLLLHWLQRPLDSPCSLDCLFCL